MMGSSLRERFIHRLAERQNWRCCYCGVRTVLETNLDNTATIDHVIPHKYSQNNIENNLVMACHRCNNLRGDMNAIAFFESKKWQRKTKKEISLMVAAINKTVPKTTLADIWPV